MLYQGEFVMVNDACLYLSINLAGMDENGRLMLLGYDSVMILLCKFYFQSLGQVRISGIPSF